MCQNIVQSVQYCRICGTRQGLVCEITCKMNYSNTYLQLMQDNHVLIVMLSHKRLIERWLGYQLPYVEVA